jgi:thiol-disulfide isomerase/thioredoxin
MSYASYKSLGKDPKAPQPETMADITRITSRDHRSALISKYPVVVIDNYTDWCRPCKLVAPHFAVLAQEYQNKYPQHLIFAKENADDEFAGVPEIHGVPCFHFYVNGSHVKDLTATGGSIDPVRENLKKILHSK